MDLVPRFSSLQPMTRGEAWDPSHLVLQEPVAEAIPIMTAEGTREQQEQGIWLEQSKALL